MNETEAPSARSASGTASAGTTCPAVPPAPITILGAFKFGRPNDLESRPGSSDVEQQTDPGEQDAEIRRGVGDERQGDAGQRGEPEHHEDVEDSLAKNQ